MYRNVGIAVLKYHGNYLGGTIVLHAWYDPLGAGSLSVLEVVRFSECSLSDVPLYLIEDLSNCKSKVTILNNQQDNGHRK